MNLFKKLDLRLGELAVRHLNQFKANWFAQNRPKGRVNGNVQTKFLATYEEIDGKQNKGGSLE